MKCNFELLFTENGIYKYFKTYIKKLFDLYTN